MTKIALIIGTGYHGEDVLHKLPWVEKMENHEFFIASRIHPKIHLNTTITNESVSETFLNQIKASLSKLQNKSNFEFMYESNLFEKKYSEEHINELEKWLGMSFKYIGSLDRRFYNKKTLKDSRNESDLYQYIASLLDYFKTFFMKNEIEIFINTIEDDVVSTVAYYTAKKLNIKILGLMWSRFPRKGIIFCEDFTEICCWNENKVKWEEIEELYSKPTIAHEDIMLKNQSHFKFRSILKRMKNSKRVLNYNRYIKNVEKLLKYEKFIFEKTNLVTEIIIYLKKLIRKSYINIILDDIDYNETYFLFPLHFTDDAQLTFREPFVDQFEIIKGIVRSLPKDNLLYVKPHPHYLGTDIKLSSIRKLKKIKEVKIINPTCSPIDLIKKSKGTITINSTTGFESLVMKTPVISFGHDFYCKDDLCYIIRDFNELPKILNNVSEFEFAKSSEIFLKKVYSNSIWIETMNLNETFVLTNNDGLNIAKSLEKILEQIKIE